MPRLRGTFRRIPPARAVTPITLKRNQDLTQGKARGLAGIRQTGRGGQGVRSCPGHSRLAVIRGAGEERPGPRLPCGPVDPEPPRLVEWSAPRPLTEKCRRPRQPAVGCNSTADLASRARPSPTRRQHQHPARPPCRSVPVGLPAELTPRFPLASVRAARGSRAVTAAGI